MNRYKTLSLIQPQANLIAALLVVILCIASHYAYSQNVPAKSAIGLKARVQKDRILLRWAVNQPMGWKIANNYGFIVERLTVARDSQTLKNTEMVRLTNRPLKPQSKQVLEKAIGNNNQAAIIYQAIYGETFGIEAQTTGISSALTKTEEMMQRHTFSLMAADQNFEAALMAGWAFVDSTAKPNEKYIYRVATAVPPSKLEIESANVFVGLDQFEELPSPIDVTAAFSNKIVTISWNYKVHEKIYNSFYVERSEDSIHFQKATDLPVTNLISQENEVPLMMHYNDSLAANDKLYWYRVRGISSFGEVSPPSKTVKGMGEDFMAFAPDVYNYEILADSSIKLQWRFPEEGKKYLKGFAISIADDADGRYTVLKSDIAIESREIVVKTQQSSNYLVVSAIDSKQRLHGSYPQFVQLDDATPPAVPTGLVGEIDSSGYISLTWAANKEKDFHGYHVYRCNFRGEEMSLLTGEPIDYPQFCDSVDMKMLNSKVYYAVAALDKRYNRSALTTLIEITKPDKNPPVAPVFSNYKLEENKVSLEWTGSSSEDVVAQRLYKKEPTNTNNQWLLVKEFEGRDSISFEDDNVKGGTMVSYTLVAVDSSNNESSPSTPLTVQIPIDKKNKAVVKDFKAQPDRQNHKILLDWACSEKGVVEYQIYKTVINAQYSLWKVIDNKSFAIEDKDVSASHIYKYAVRAVFNDGSMSVMKEVKVEF